MNMGALRKVLKHQQLKWRARRDSNSRPSESKSPTHAIDFNGYSELSRSVHALKALSFSARSECRATHFVRFPDLHGDQFWSAVRTFGEPDFLHRYWDRRARREIADGDLVLFAKGEADQPHAPFNGNDEAYALPLIQGGRA